MTGKIAKVRILRNYLLFYPDIHLAESNMKMEK